MVGYKQDVALESGEAELAQNERDVVLRRLVGDVDDESEEIDRPQIVVADGVFKVGPVDPVAVVEIAFVGRVAEYFVHDDLFFPLTEPAFLAATQDTTRLRRASWHEKEGEYTDDSGDESFKGKEVAPLECVIRLGLEINIPTHPTQSVQPSQFYKSSCQECADYLRDT